MPDSSGKLYFLKDRSRRLSSRHVKRRPEGGASAEAEGRPALPREAVWLSRFLVAEAAYLVLYWVAIGLGAVSVPEPLESRVWVYSFLPADLLVAGVTGLAAWELLRGSPRKEMLLVLAAGGLIFLSLSRLTYGIASSFVGELAPGRRLHVTLMGVCLYVGLWAASYGLRARRGGE